MPEDKNNTFSLSDVLSGSPEKERQRTQTQVSESTPQTTGFTIQDVLGGSRQTAAQAGQRSFQRVVNNTFDDKKLSETARQKRDALIQSVSDMRGQSLPESTRRDTLSKLLKPIYDSVEDQVRNTDMDSREIANAILEGIDTDAFRERTQKAKQEIPNISETPETIIRARRANEEFISEEEVARAEFIEKASTIQDLAREMVQAPLRSAHLVGRSILELEDPRKVSFTPKTELQKALFGRDREFTFATEGGEVLQVFGQSAQSPLAFPLGILFAGLDLTPVGLSKVSRVARNIAGTKDTAKISKELGRVMKGTGEEIDSLAQLLRNEDNASSIAKIIKNAGKKAEHSVSGSQAKKAAETARLLEKTRTTQAYADAARAARNANDADEFARGLDQTTMARLTEAGDDVRQLFDTLRRIQRGIDNGEQIASIRSTVRAETSGRPVRVEETLAQRVARQTLEQGRAGRGARVADDIPPQLAEEARRANNVEEFVEAQTRVFRGEGQEVRGIPAGIDAAGQGVNRESVNVLGDNVIYTSPRREVAEKYGDVQELRVNLQNPLRLEDEIDLLRFLDENNLRNPLDPMVQAQGAEAVKQATGELQQAIKNVGHDGVIVKVGDNEGNLLNRLFEDDQVVVFGQSAVKTKSQLTDIFNRVKGGDEAIGTRLNRQSLIEPQAFANEFRFGLNDIQFPDGVGRNSKKILNASSRTEQQKAMTTATDKFNAKFEESFGKENVSKLNKRELDFGKVDEEKYKIFKEFRDSVGEGWTNMQRTFQDDWVSVKRLVKDPNANVTEMNDMYLAEILYHGRVAEKIKGANRVVEELDADIVATAQRTGQNVEALEGKVNTFLHARHAPERNKQLKQARGAGMSDQEAAEALKRIRSGDDAAEVERLANQVQEFHNRTLDELLEGEVITRELYDTLKNTYKNHVPLNRIMEEAEDIGQALSGPSGFDVTSSGLRRAKGSEREVSDIFTNAVINYKQAVVRAEKNRVDLATLQFVRDNKDSFGHIFEEFKPRAIGTDFKGNVITEQITDPQTLVLKEKGKTVAIKIKDKKLAATLRGINREYLPGVIRMAGSFAKFIGAAATRYNPAFVFSNKVRDLQEAAIYLSSKGDIGNVAATKSLAMEPQNVKGVLDSLRGRDTEITRLYKQMKEDGGTTGGFGVGTRDMEELDIEKIKSLNRKSGRRAAVKFARGIEAWNTIFEDSTRLTAYRTALAQGATRKRAAQLAKEASVNFNKTGTGGPVMNSLFLFSNAALQGSTKMIFAMRNPKTAISTTAMVFGAVNTIDSWNDRVDPQWRGKVTEWDRLNSLNIFWPNPDNPEKAQYFSIPMSWGVKPIGVAAKETGDALRGHAKDPSDAFSGVLSSVVESYNPLGGTDLIQSITPTILDIPVDIARNRAWYGGPIRPDWNTYAPESIQYFESLEDSALGRLSIYGTRGLSQIGIEISPANVVYGAQQLTAGAGTFTSDTFTTAISAAKGDLPPIGEVPIAGRFFTSRTVEEVGGGTEEAEKIKEVLGESEREDFYLQQRAEDAYNQLKNLPKEEQIRRFNQLRDSDPEIAKRVFEIKKEEAQEKLTYTQRMIKRLGVENGDRAKYIWENKLKGQTKQVQAELWNEYVRKGIISSQVSRQLIELKRKESN